MVVDSPAQLAKMKTEWHAVFDGLPPEDGNVGALPEEQKLVWTELPKCQHRRREPSSSSARSVGGVSSALESPVVKPITGPGRTAADVQRELRAYQSRVRRDAADSDNPAVFQADYLFVQLPGRELELHRVVHGLLIEDATAPHLSFSTSQYTRFPQPGVPGFGGYFSLSPNPAYDEMDLQRRPMQIRH
eukprot:1975911-Pleurochrysis_carterae.AAC.1